MDTQSSSNAVDLQKLLAGAARLELRLLNAGVEAMQVYVNQASRFSNLASETLDSIQDDKATLSDAARTLAAFSRENALVFATLSQRLSVAYYHELEGVVRSVVKRARRTEPEMHADAGPPAESAAANVNAATPARKPRGQGRAARRR